MLQEKVCCFFLSHLLWRVTRVQGIVVAPSYNSSLQPLVAPSSLTVHLRVQPKFRHHCLRTCKIFLSRGPRRLEEFAFLFPQPRGTYSSNPCVFFLSVIFSCPLMQKLLSKQRKSGRWKIETTHEDTPTYFHTFMPIPCTCICVSIRAHIREFMRTYSRTSISPTHTQTHCTRPHALPLARASAICSILHCCSLPCTLLCLCSAIITTSSESFFLLNVGVRGLFFLCS